MNILNKDRLVLQISPSASGSNIAQDSTGDKKGPGDNRHKQALNWESKLVLILSANKQPYKFKKTYQQTMSLYILLQKKMAFPKVFCKAFV